MIALNTRGQAIAGSPVPPPPEREQVAARSATNFRRTPDPNAMTYAIELAPVADTLRAYIRSGWVLVPIPPGSKRPNARRWNDRARCWASPDQVPDHYTGNVGLAHAYSGSCALDVDSAELATLALAEHGIDLAALQGAADAVHIRSGRAGRDKLLYRLPAGAPPPASVNRNAAGDGFELRCATRTGHTVQDVLPPSIHPDTGKPYEWAGDWRALPELPHQLLALWHRLLRTAEASEHAYVTPPGKRKLPDRILEGERNATLFNLARGLVTRGHDEAGVNQRLQRVNAERCDPPLCATEVDGVVASACAYGAPGFAAIPRAAVYSHGWKALSSAARSVATLAYCRDNGQDDCTFALTEADFAEWNGISKNPLRNAIAELLAVGILVRVAEPRNSQLGRKPALYAIASKWRHVRQGKNVIFAPRFESDPLHRRQCLGGSVSGPGWARRKTDKAA